MGDQIKKKSDVDLELIDWKSFNVPLCAGVDEVGRGCLAGPVFAGAVILRSDTDIPGLTDSKLLSPEARSDFAEIIKEKSLAWAVAWSTVEEIEKINILQASLLAMKRAIEKLSAKPELVLIDGNQKVHGPWLQKLFVKGDLRLAPISAASIIAKTARDELMVQLDGEYPGYELAVHKGYGTPKHRAAIQKLGASRIHRKTFGGVREFLDLQK